MLDASTYEKAIKSAKAELMKSGAIAGTRSGVCYGYLDAQDLVHDGVVQMLRKVRDGWEPTSPLHEIRYLRRVMHFTLINQHNRSVETLDLDV